MSDDVLFCDEFTDYEAHRTLRITVDHDGGVYVTVENTLGPLAPMTITGGQGLLIWLQAIAERATFAMQRREAA